MKQLPLAQTLLHAKNWKQHAQTAALQLAALLLGFLWGGTGFAGSAFATTAPFAIGLCAAGSLRFLLFEALGASAGCLLLLPWPANVCTMAAVATAGLFNMTMRKFGFRRSLAAPLTALLCSFAAGATSLWTEQLADDPLRWVFALSGAALAACSAFFVSMVQGIHRTPTEWHVSRRECAALLLCCSMVLTALGSLGLGYFKPTHVLAVLFVLAAACCWREVGGAIAGCCAGAAMALCGDTTLAPVFAVGGLLAGVFSQWLGLQKSDNQKPSPFYCLPVAGGFALCCVFYVALQASVAQDPAATVVFSIEALGAILLFLAVPPTTWARLRRRFVSPEDTMLSPPETDASLQLLRTADALRKVGEYVGDVSHGLSKLQLSYEQNVSARLTQQVCALCPECRFCTQDHAEQTADFCLRALDLLQRDGKLLVEDLVQLRRDVGLHLPCRKPDLLREHLLRACDYYAARATCQHNEQQLRSAATAQFETLSELVEELSAQMQRRQAFEVDTAHAAQRILEEHGFRTKAVSCVRQPAHENAALLLAAVQPEAYHSTREMLAKAISSATGVAFNAPECATLHANDGELLFSFAQQPRFALHTGAVQMSSGPAEYCGDFFEHYNDEHGRDVLVISDGMGTGGRAAIDSSLATAVFKLLTQAGLSFAGAVRIVNQALLLKSNEETLATLDAVGVNLYTGEAEFCKAGGAVSFVRRGSQTERISLSALPAGILRSIHPAATTLHLDADDLIVLLSDGMLSDDDTWLCEAINDWPNHDMQALAEHLVHLAVQNRNEREDDLTVLCAHVASFFAPKTL